MPTRYKGKIDPLPVDRPAPRPAAIGRGTAVIVCPPSKYAGDRGAVLRLEGSYARVKFLSKTERWVKLIDLRIDRGGT